jgi:hypothetical protein
MKHSRGTSRGACLTMRLAIVLCLALAFVAIPAVALAAPVTTSNAVATYNNTAVISITATTGAGNPAYVGTRYWFDASAPATVSAWPSAASVSISTLGAHTLRYYSVDASGVIEVTQVKNFTIADTIKPTTISDVSAAYLNTAVIHLSAVDSVGGSGVAHTYFKVDGGATTEGIVITVSTYGVHTIEFWSVDTAGNTESVVTGSFLVDDSTAPVTTSDRVATYYNSTAHITLTATDTGGSGVDATYYNLDGAGWDVGTSITANTLGAHSLSFYSVDIERNKEATKTVSFTVLAGPAPTDTVAPVSTSNAVATYLTSPATIRLSSVDNEGGTGMAALRYRVDGGAIVEVNPSTIHAAVGTPELGIPADHSPAAPTTCACHATLIPATHSAGASPATCACHVIEKPTAPVDVPNSHAARTEGNCKGCHPAAGVIMPSSSSNPSHYGQTAGYVGGGECKACHTFNVLPPITPPPPAGSLNATVVVSGLGAHTIEFWGEDVAGNVETPHKTASFTIAPVEDHTITASAGTGGVIAPSGAQTVEDGSNLTFTITANSGFHVADVLVDGVSVGAVAAYGFTNITADHTISATFAPNTFTITKTAGAGGSIGGATTVNQGSDAVYTITPDSGFRVADVLVDGVSVGAVSSYTFSSVVANHTISATFAANSTSITIRTSGTLATIGNTRTLSGAVTPVGMIGHNIVAMVKKPGRTFYSYSSNRTVYDLGGAGAWLYKYKFIAGMTKGLYVFRADVPAASGFLASSSGTVTIRLR